MRKLIVAVFLFLVQIAHAQTVKLDGEDILEDGKVVAKMINKGSVLLPKFSIQNTDGEELLLIENDVATQGNFMVTFSDRDDIALIRASIPVKKSIVKELWNYGVIKDGALNENGVKKLLSISKRLDKKDNIIIDNRSANTSSRDNYTIVDRNTDAPLFIAAGSIKQDFKLVAKYKSEQTMVDNMPGKSITFYSIENKVIAKAKFQNFAEEAQLTTYKDNKKQNISISNSNDLQVLDEIIKELISLGYL